jgi:subtilisin family serine protease
MAQSSRKKPSKRTAGRKENEKAPAPLESTSFASLAVPLAGKLDPILALATVRPPRGAGLRSLAEGAQGGSASLRKAEAVGELPLRLHSLAASVTESSIRELAAEDMTLVLIDTRNPEEATKVVEAAQGRAHSLTSTTLLVRAPRSRLAAIASHVAVDYVEASTRLRPRCDLAHSSTRLVRSGVRTVQQTGRGVLVGVVDTGIDAEHPGFKTNGKTRIVDYFDQETEQRYDSAAIDAGKATASPDTNGHGTHVAGIAAGNGGGSPAQTLLGVAPEADLAIVKTTFESAHVVAGIEHIFKVAEDRNQPCVVNLSLGGHVGGHDGSTVAERTID